MDDKILLDAFYNGVSSDLFIHKLYNQEPQTMAELIHSAQSFMNADDAIITKRKKKGERLENSYVHHSEQGSRPKKAKVGEKRDRDGKKAGSSSRQYSNYTPLNTLLDQVLIHIKDDLSLKWPERMKGNPSKRNKSKYCRFHRDYEHDTDECYDLKQQIEAFIKQGKLKDFIWRDHKDKRQPMKGKAEELVCPPFGELKIIVGGMSTGSLSRSGKNYLREVQIVQISRRPPRMIKNDEPAIVFTDEDAKRTHHPHDDAIVITLTIANFTTRMVLIDNGSSADIIYY